MCYNNIYYIYQNILRYLLCYTTIWQNLKNLYTQYDTRYDNYRLAIEDSMHSSLLAKTGCWFGSLEAISEADMPEVLCALDIISNKLRSIAAFSSAGNIRLRDGNKAERKASSTLATSLGISWFCLELELIPTGLWFVFAYSLLFVASPVVVSFILA